MTKKTIFLHGHLGEIYPEPISVEAETIAEAMRILEQIPELEPEDGQPHPVTIRGVDSEIALYAKTSVEEIHVYPRTGGAGGKSGIMQVIVGIALIAVGMAFPALTLLGGAITSGSLIMGGAMMLLGGILQMLTPMPSVNSPGEQDSSNMLGANKNTVRIGTHILVAYGNVRMAGHYLSFDVDAKSRSGVSSLTAASSGVPILSEVPQGEAVTVNQSVFVEYDKSPVQAVPVMPVFASPIAGPGNVPSSAWSAVA